MPFRDLAKSTSGYLNGIHMDLTDETTMEPIYYVTVICENGASAKSEEVYSRY